VCVRAPLICNFACNFRATRQYFSSDVKIKGDVSLRRFDETWRKKLRRARLSGKGEFPSAESQTLLLCHCGDKSICSKQKHTHTHEAILNKAEAAGGGVISQRVCTLCNRAERPCQPLQFPNRLTACAPLIAPLLVNQIVAQAEEHLIRSFSLLTLQTAT
jgi:hypothetical protein